MIFVNDFLIINFSKNNQTEPSKEHKKTNKKKELQETKNRLAKKYKDHSQTTNSN